MGGASETDTEIAGAPCSKTVASEIEIAGVPGTETEILEPLPGPETTIPGPGASSFTSLSLSYCPSGTDILGTAVRWG